MKVKLIAIGLLAAAGITIGLVRSASTVQKKSLSFDNDIKWYANEAKAKGLQKVRIEDPYGCECLAGTITAEEAFGYSTVVVASLIAKESSYRKDKINTWNKFAVDEVLSEAKELPWPGWQPITLPSTLLPLQPSEILIANGGGTVNIDGVDVEQINEDYPAYELNQKYVLLIHLYPSGVARTFGGPVGVFKVLENDKLAPIVENEHRTRRDFKDLYGDSLDLLRKHLKHK